MNWSESDGYKFEETTRSQSATLWYDIASFKHLPKSQLNLPDYIAFSGSPDLTHP